MIHALFSGSYGYWPPYLTGDAGLVTMAGALAKGIVLAQRGMAEVLGDRGVFVHVDAGLRYAGDVAGEHRELVERMRHEAFLVEDLVTGRVSEQHPLREHLAGHGLTGFDWFEENAVQPDVMGVNYYPRHSTELLEEGVHHRGGFADPRPTRDDGAAGLEEVLVAYERYGAPVMLTETCVTGTVAERLAWLDESVATVRRMRADGHPVVGYTWWPVFDMYEWTWRHSTAPRADHLLTMGLWDLVETDDALLRRKNPVADRFRAHATSSLNRP